jgi:formylglycine-generating enzyme required for sulfatase activity
MPGRKAAAFIPARSYPPWIYEVREGYDVPSAVTSGSKTPKMETAGDSVWIPGGTYTMGSDHHYPEEAPAHRVSVDGFFMDRYLGRVVICPGGIPARCFL